MAPVHDLMVSLDISSRALMGDKEQDQPNFQLSYWQDIIPNEAHELASISPWILVHTTPHSNPWSEHIHRLRTKSAAHQNDADRHTTDMGFCGWDKPLSFIRLDLSPEYFQEAAAELHGFKYVNSQGLQVSHVHDPKIIQAGEWLLDELSRDNNYEKLYVNSLLNILSIHILRYYRSSAVIPPAYDQISFSSREVGLAIEYMQAHLSQDITLADLSKITHASPSHLGRLFKRSTKLTPHQFLIRLRAMHARELLLSQDMTISEVALQSGFVDQSHLNRHFKRIFGVTPKSILTSGR